MRLALFVFLLARARARVPRAVTSAESPIANRSRLAVKQGGVLSSGVQPTPERPPNAPAHGVLKHALPLLESSNSSRLKEEEERLESERRGGGGLHDTAITTSLGPSSRTNSMGRFQQHQKDLPGAACGQLIDAVPAQLEQHERSSSDYTTTSRRLYSGLARLKAVDEGNLYTRAREKNGRNLSSTTSRATTATNEARAATTTPLPTRASSVTGTSAR